MLTLEPRLAPYTPHSPWDVGWPSCEAIDGLGIAREERLVAWVPESQVWQVRAILRDVPHLVVTSAESWRERADIRVEESPLAVGVQGTGGQLDPFYPIVVDPKQSVYEPATIAHEIGHTLGLGHVSAVDGLWDDITNIMTPSTTEQSVHLYGWQTAQMDFAAGTYATGIYVGMTPMEVESFKRTFGTRGM